MITTGKFKRTPRRVLGIAHDGRIPLARRAKSQVGIEERVEVGKN